MMEKPQDLATVEGAMWAMDATCPVERKARFAEVCEAEVKKWAAHRKKCVVRFEPKVLPFVVVRELVRRKRQRACKMAHLEKLQGMVDALK